MRVMTLHVNTIYYVQEMCAKCRFVQSESYPDAKPYQLVRVIFNQILYYYFVSRLVKCLIVEISNNMVCAVLRYSYIFLKIELRTI